MSVGTIQHRLETRSDRKRNESMSKSILVADDNASTRRIVRTGLEQAGFSICGEATDGLDCIDKASQLKPDLVILDLSMPRMNGVEVASVLRGRLPKTPIVLFTMYEAGPAVLAAAGVTSMVRKADGIIKLTRRVQELLGAENQIAAESPAK